MKVVSDQDPGQKTYIALKNLVDNSWYMQRKAYENGLYKNGSIGFLKEFCTVKMCTARRSGHSTAIARLCCEYFNKAILFCHNQQTAENLHLQFRPYVNNITKELKDFIELNNGESKYHFFSTGNLQGTRGIETEAMIIDCASFMSEKKKEEIEDLAIVYLRPPAPFFLIYVE